MIKRLGEMGVKYDVNNAATTNSSYVNFVANGVKFDVRLAAHTKISDTYDNTKALDFKFEDGKINDVTLDSSAYGFKTKEILNIIDEVKRFNELGYKPNDDITKVPSNDKQIDWYDYPYIGETLFEKVNESVLRQREGEYRELQLKEERKTKERMKTFMETFYPFTTSDGAQVVIGKLDGKRLVYKDGVRLKRSTNGYALDEALKEADNTIDETRRQFKLEEKKQFPFDEWQMQTYGNVVSNVFKVDNDAVRFRNDEEIEKVNQRFNEELDNLTEANADKVILLLGNPSDVLLSSGIENKPLKLHGSKLMKKAKLHGFSPKELQNLPAALTDPIAVFDNYKKTDNRSILTELKTKDGNVLVSLTIGKGIYVDFNIIASAFGKANDSIVKWINKGFATYINKEKALNYLYLSAPIAEAAENSELSSATKIVKDFVNPKIDEEKLREGYGLYTNGELSFINDPVAKMLGENKRTEADQKVFAERECRRKTGRQVRVKIEGFMQDILDRYAREDTDYLFPILYRTVGKHLCPRRYSAVLHNYNRTLQTLAMKVGVEAHLSSYVPRHSWASMAYRHNVSLPVISQALGHGDTHITLIYIRGIDDRQVAKANKKTVVGNPCTTS